MLYAAISRRKSRAAARYLHDPPSVARDLRTVAGAFGFGSEWRAKLSGNAQSAVADCLRRHVRTVEGHANSARNYVNARTYPPFASGYSNGYANRPDGCPC